jgi:tetratricopeptide (TPR) repeat protein
MTMKTGLFLAVLATWPLVASANAKHDAKVHIAKATKAHQEGKFEVALDELLAAYKLDPQPELLFAIAQVYGKLDRCSDAVPYYEKFLAATKDTQATEIVNQAIDACKKQLAAAQPPPVEEPPPPPPPPVKVDEPPPPPPKLDEPPPPPRREDTPLVVVEHPAGPTPWYRDTLGDALVGGGVLAGVVSLVMYTSAGSDLDAAEASATLAEYNQHLDDANGKRTYSLVLAGAGVALVGAGIYHYTRRDAGKSSMAVVPQRGGGLVVLTGGF